MLGKHQDPLPAKMTEDMKAADNITSIADAVLKLKELRESNKNLNEPDIEERFASLSLAFKTDKCTLGKRLELQQRQRDIAEKNIECELRALRESLNALNQLCTDSEMREVITKTQQHVDIVQQATNRMSSRAETYGAIQQEQRMNCAFETMLNYVEHLKQTNDKEHMELEEYRRLLAENNLLPDEKSNGEGIDDLKRALPPRSHSLSGSSKPDLQRRSSSNAFAHLPLSDIHKPLSRENSKSHLPSIASNSGVDSRSRLLSAVCLLSNNYESPRPTNGTTTPSSLTMSPKSRRSSLPVGPVTNATPGLLNVGASLPSTPPSSRIQNIVAEHLDSPKEEREMETDRMHIPIARTDSLESEISRNGEVRDSDSTCDFHTRSSSADEDKDNKDSSDLKTFTSNSFDNKEEITSFEPLLQEPFDNEMESEFSTSFECDVSSQPIKTQMILHKLQNWAFNKGTLRWDNSTVIRRLRYLLSAMCVAGAMLSFVITFMPSSIAA